MPDKPEICWSLQAITASNGSFYVNGAQTTDAHVLSLLQDEGLKHSGGKTRFMNINRNYDAKLRIAELLPMPPGHDYEQEERDNDDSWAS